MAPAKRGRGTRVWKPALRASDYEIMRSRYQKLETVLFRLILGNDHLQDVPHLLLLGFQVAGKAFLRLDFG